MDREFPNTSLFLQNLLLMQDNERMRRAAQQLEQENKALLAQINQRYQQQQQHQGAGGPSGSGSGSGGSHSASAASAGAGANHKARKAAGKQPK